jgi:hypothetical protein
MLNVVIIMLSKTRLCEAIVCTKTKFDEWHNHSYLFGTIQGVGYNFYHCAQKKLLSLTFF